MKICKHTVYVYQNCMKYLRNIFVHHENMMEKNLNATNNWNISHNSSQIFIDIPKSDIKIWFSLSQIQSRQYIDSRWPSESI